MKFKFKVVLMVCLLGLIALAQADKPKAAVYIVGNPEGRDVLRLLVNNFLVKSGRYQMVAVDAIDIVAREHKRQASGAVSDADIAKMGEDAGASYVCVVEQVKFDGSTYISTKMVGVQSKIAEFSEVTELERGQKIIEVVEKQITKMFGSAPASKASGSTAGAGTFVDPRDNQSYRTVRIGNLTWMAENLNFNTAGSWCYDNDSFNCRKYGRLYTWDAARGACPDGWHLPSRAEWDDLVQAAGGKEGAGLRLKSKTQWNGTDDHSWSALPGGIRWEDRGFSDAGSSGHWWSATGSGSGAWIRRILSNGDSVGESEVRKSIGYSARCVRDM